jgi:hypothetical protein
MKFVWSRARAFTVAATLVAVSNAVALGGVAYNRSGKPDSVLQLTERELPIQYWSWPDNENSAIHLELHWRLAFDDYEGLLGVRWLTLDQLRRLGFDVPAAGATSDEMQRSLRQPAREVFLVLEYDGPAYQTMLDHAHEKVRKAEAALATSGSESNVANLRGAKAQVEAEQYRSSRLFVVAADLDSDALRQRYPDRKHYAIVRGRIGLRMGGVDGLVPQIIGINTDTIRVPYAYRALVEPYVSDRSFTDREPRYAATVHFGRRHEPWIAQLDALTR